MGASLDGSPSHEHIPSHHAPRLCATRQPVVQEHQIELTGQWPQHVELPSLVRPAPPASVPNPRFTGLAITIRIVRGPVARLSSVSWSKTNSVGELAARKGCEMFQGQQWGPRAQSGQKKS
jgi:hypothetical protein